MKIESGSAPARTRILRAAMAPWFILNASRSVMGLEISPSSVMYAGDVVLDLDHDAERAVPLRPLQQVAWRFEGGHHRVEQPRVEQGAQHVADLVVGVAPGHRRLVADPLLARDAADHGGGVHGHPTPGLGEAGALQYERRADPAGGDDDRLRFDLEPVALAGAAHAAGLATLYDEIIDAALPSASRHRRRRLRRPTRRHSTSPRSGNRACSGHRT